MALAWIDVAAQESRTSWPMLCCLVIGFLLVDVFFVVGLLVMASCALLDHFRLSRERAELRQRRNEFDSKVFSRGRSSARSVRKSEFQS